MTMKSLLIAGSVIAAVAATGSVATPRMLGAMATTSRTVWGMLPSRGAAPMRGVQTSAGPTKATAGSRRVAGAVGDSGMGFWPRYIALAFGNSASHYHSLGPVLAVVGNTRLARAAERRIPKEASHRQR